MNIRTVISPGVHGFPIGTLLVIGTPDPGTPFPYPCHSLLDPSNRDALSDYGHDNRTRPATRQELDAAVATLTDLITELRKPIAPDYEVGDDVYAARTGHCTAPCRFEAQLTNGLGLFSRVTRIDGYRDTLAANDLHYWIAPTEKFQKKPNR